MKSIRREALPTTESAARFDVVASVHGGQKLDHVVSAKEALVTVEAQLELGGDVAEERDNVRAVDELTFRVSVMRPHCVREA